MYYVNLITEENDINPTLFLYHFLPYLGFYPEKAKLTTLDSVVNIYILGGPISREKAIESLDAARKKINKNLYITKDDDCI